MLLATIRNLPIVQAKVFRELHHQGWPFLNVANSYFFKSAHCKNQKNEIHAVAKIDPAKPSLAE